MPNVIYDNQFWLYTVDPDADEPVMLINTYIGFDPEQGPGIIGSIFEKELYQLDALCVESNRRLIKVHINSPGGAVDDGLSIYSAILRTTTKVDTIVTGMAASIAGVIFQAGRQRIMSDYSYLMYHDPYGSDDAKSMEAYTDMIVKAIVSRTGRSEEDVSKIMSKTSWISAEEAVETGFADKIEGSEDFNKKRSAPADVFQAKAFYKESAQILNNLFKNKAMPENQFPFSKIANKLGLHEQASSDAVVDVLTGILNKKDEFKKKCEDMEDEMTKTKRSIDDTKKELDDLKEKHTKLKADYDDLKKSKDDDDTAKAANKTQEDDKAKAKADEDAKNLVDTAAIQGRIPSDDASLALWKASAVKDLAATKAIIDKMPINKRQAAKIKTVAKVEVQAGSVVAGSMNSLRKKFLEKTEA